MAKTIENINHPDSYKGIYSFHKYWGKKPTESLAFFIENYTCKSDIVLDPFLGSGFISRESLSRQRRFIGIDINPLAVEHTNFLLDLPSASIFQSAIKNIEKNIRQKINETYLTTQDQIASHYLWQGGQLLKVWTKSGSSRKRIKINPTPFDQEKIASFAEYSVRNIRPAIFFSNSRINSNKAMSIYDLFTQRALHNIDLILDEIQYFPEKIKRALLLTLTSSSGQMSSMVFAITNRGKMEQKISDKIEVGSWVIGYWRPQLHFEINVWNCFANKAQKLYKSLLNVEQYQFEQFASVPDLLSSWQGAVIINDDCLNAMKQIPEKTVQLICTDPPHSDRIPYLELSEMWNSLLNKQVIFEQEIVVSNAKERDKTKNKYLEKMQLFLVECSRVLKDDGLCLIYFNARDQKSWNFLEILENNKFDFQLIGSFPIKYSANSVIQDNRKGGLKEDYVLVLNKKGNFRHFYTKLEQIPGWLNSIPHLV